ncbi:MAG: hypothetical protein ACXWJ4_12395 [Methyloceanibacter sp.]
MQQLYRMLVAALGWFALGLQYVLIVRYKTDGDLIAAAIRFSSYFTLLSNILVALAMTLPWLMPESRERCRRSPFQPGCCSRSPTPLTP